MLCSGPTLPHAYTSQNYKNPIYDREASRLKGQMSNAASGESESHDKQGTIKVANPLYYDMMPEYDMMYVTEKQ